MEEWISLNEYMRRYKTGYEAVKNMIANKEVECRMTPGGYYKIKVGGDSVSREMYEKERCRRIKAETILQLLRDILVKENEEQII